jgi:hypothetical protein
MAQAPVREKWISLVGKRILGPLHLLEPLPQLLFHVALMISRRPKFWLVVNQAIP